MIDGDGQGENDMIGEVLTKMGNLVGAPA